MTARLNSVPVLVVAAAMTGSFAAEREAQLAAGPETFHVQATVTASGQGAGAATLTAPIVIYIERYTPEHERVTMTDGLKYRGYQGFVWALREAPAVGSLEAGGDKFVIRYAHQQAAGAGRTITLVTEKPVAFIGIGRPGAKPAAGYEVAVVRLDVDASGRGEGLMVAAARVKPSGTGGVQIDDYAETPLKLKTTAPPSK